MKLVTELFVPPPFANYIFEGDSASLSAQEIILIEGYLRLYPIGRYTWLIVTDEDQTPILRWASETQAIDNHVGLTYNILILE